MGPLVCSLVALLLSGGPAGKAMPTTLQDDALLLHRPAAAVRRYVRQIASLGADRVRLTASWSGLAPSPGSREEPKAPFDPTDSRTYPDGGWRALDIAVKDVVAAGMQPMIDIAFWAPRWAVDRPASDPSRERWWIDARKFGEFATAVATRYSGHFRDPGNPARRLPAVRLWTPWNEPNHPSFLMPQWRRDGHGGWRPESPHIYRAMYDAAYDAIKHVDPGNQVLLGGTASTGSARPGRGGVAPLAFVRALTCVDDDLRPLDVPECRGYTPLRADGFSHHPYSRGLTPAGSDPFADNAPLGDQGRLETLLDELYARGRLAQRLPIYDTEYGYETRPPDPYQQYTPEQQARFIGWSTYLAWKDPDTRMFAQFLLRDVDPSERYAKGSRGYWRSYQTGLFYVDGRPKPAADAFRLPFWAQLTTTPAGTGVLLFGQVRPGQGPRMVRVERREEPGGLWVPVVTSGRSCDSGIDFLTDADGFFLHTAPYTGPTEYRLSWRDPGGRWVSGVPIPVDGSIPVALPAG